MSRIHVLAVCCAAAAASAGASIVRPADLQRSRLRHDSRRELHSPALVRVSALRGGARVPVVAAKAGKAGGTLQTLALFCAWYAFNIWYSLVAKMVLQWWKSPWLFTVIQLGIGALWVGAQWAPLPTFGLNGANAKTFTLRPLPELTCAEMKSLVPIAACLAAGHVASTMAMFYGTVAFANVVKTAEPLFTCLFSALLLKQFFAKQTYATLLPIMGGVAFASAKELSFSWMSLTTAMSSNVAFALRAILAKKSMASSSKGIAKLSSANLFAVVNMLAFALTTPLALLLELPKASASWDAALAKGVTGAELLKLILVTGVTYYMYNEFAFMCLGQVDPVTHAVANTIKRVAVIAVSIVYFKNPITKEGMLGSAVAVVGVLLYSLALDAEKATSAKAAKLVKARR
ncbi:triose-phosphate transporter family-domain-containing protein [Pavlovales sp. CCMP2436]|nr:triose-phosphate transporter family-domain-containing protein [Pavlovales sp. CCMP2436]